VVSPIRIDDSVPGIDPAAVAYIRKRGRDFIIALYGALRSIRLYPVEHTAVQKNLADLAAMAAEIVERALRARIGARPPHPDRCRDPTSPPRERWCCGEIVPHFNLSLGGEVAAKRRVRGPCHERPQNQVRRQRRQAIADQFDRR